MSKISDLEGKNGYHQVPSAIVNIKIEQLFGRFDYQFSIEGRENIIILYGNNGTGKTTILNIIYHLLSRSPTTSHKSNLAQILFKKIEISFRDGTVLIVSRTDEKLVGPYYIELFQDKNVIAHHDFVWDDEEDTIKSYDTSEDWKIIDNYLSEIGLQVFYLTEDRILKSDAIIIDEEHEYILRTRRKKISDEDPRRIQSIRAALNRAKNWINLAVKKSSDSGDLNVNTMFSKIIETISSEEESKKITNKDIKKMLSRLEELAKISQRYSKLQITSEIEVKDILSSVKKSKITDNVLIWRVLKTYVDIIETKLNALQDIYELIQLFVGTLNEFFQDKKIEYNFYDGIRIKISQDDLNPNILSPKEKQLYLNPNFLSSGEKQLMRLLCNVLSARDQFSIFIIDEPEISLNAKWQRKLIKTLLELTQGSSFQFIFATHSIELLTKYQTEVISLNAS